MIVLCTVVFALVVTTAGLLAPDRMRLMVPITSSVSVGEIMFPIGHWLAVLAWAACVSWQHTSNRATVIYRCVGVGFALHVLLLVTLFVPRLDDRAAFSAAVYLVYARLFCGVVLAASTAWVLTWLQRMRAHAKALTTLELPLLVGWVALLMAVARHDALMAIIAALGGVGMAVLPRIVASHQPGLIETIRGMASHDRVVMLVVFGFALGFRLLYVTRIMSDANYLDAGADGRIYDELARSIAAGDSIPATFVERFPLLLLGYVWFVAAIYSVFGPSYVALTAVQSVIGAATCLLLYEIARQLFGRTAARIAALFAAVSFPLVFAAATIGHQALDVFLTTLVVWLLLRLVTVEAGAKGWAAAGIIVGLAFAVRETNIFLILFILPWVALAHPGGWRMSGRALAALVVGVALAVTPWLAPKLWNRDQRQAMRDHFDRMYRGEGEPTSMPRPDLVSPVADPRGALTQLQEEPGRIAGDLARAYARNFAVQFFTQPYGGFDLVFLRKGSEYSYGMWFYAYALTVAGTVVALRRIRRGGLQASGIVLILGVIVSRTVPHLVLVSNYRHRVPIEPLLILLASVGAVAAFREVTATAAKTSTSGFTGSDWRVSHSNGR